MEGGKPSVTAMQAAMVRAAHLLWDEPPKIFADTLALRLCGCESEAALRAQLDRLDVEAVRRVTSVAVMRSRYLEDEVDKAVGRGVSQYVILGAGLDSFAYRRMDLVKLLRIFEVDHPATQAWKRTRLQEAGVELPPNLSLVPVDFEKDSVIAGLRGSGYRMDAPAFFSWLGVTVYLTHDAIFRTLRMVAALAPGTEIIFEYMAPKESVDQDAQRILAVVMANTAAHGEPFRSFFEPAELAEQVRKLGFVEVSDFGPLEAEARYFAGRTDGLSTPRLSHYMRARVGPRSQ